MTKSACIQQKLLSGACMEALSLRHNKIFFRWGALVLVGHSVEATKASKKKAKVNAY